MNLMEVKGLTKQFKTSLAVDHIDFHIKEGEILGFLGPNGAGKSTTINMITSLTVPTEGTIMLRNESMVQNPKKLRRILGIVPQEIALYPELSGYENLSFFGRLYGLRGSELKERIEDITEIIGLREKLKEKVETYSGGMKRRINIGAALLHSPDLLVMDEPTVGIDPQSRNHILETVRRLNERGMTILYTSHYMEEVEFLCDRIYIIDKGKIIASGTKEELKDSISRDEKMEVTLSTTSDSFQNHLESHAKVKAVHTAADLHHHAVYDVTLEKGCHIAGDVFSWASDAGVEVIGIKVKPPTLEDVFLQLTGRALRD